MKSSTTSAPFRRKLILCFSRHIRQTKCNPKQPLTFLADWYIMYDSMKCPLSSLYSTSAIHSFKCTERKAVWLGFHLFEHIKKCRLFVASRQAQRTEQTHARSFCAGISPHTWGRVVGVSLPKRNVRGEGG